MPGGFSAAAPRDPGTRGANGMIDVSTVGEDGLHREGILQRRL